ncbi:MAG: hypothetical protein J2O46_03955 [Nocardioides sp.]|nr:hypothetical protein [Nocardioides sp.]
MSEYAAEADLEEQLQPVVEEPSDDEAAVAVAPRRDDVDEADYAEQAQEAGDDDGYDY